jgi:hypothetical protein
MRIKFMAPVFCGVVAMATLAAAQTQQPILPVQTPSAPPAIGQAALVFQVGIHRYLADGRVGGSAGDSGTESFQSYVWTPQSLCGFTASNDAPTSPPGFGWHFEGTVVSRTSTQMTVRVTWKRWWQHGARVADGPGGSQTVTLRDGERIELDRVTPVGPSSCGAVDARLEASVLPPMAYRMATQTFRGRGAGSAGTRGGRGGVAAGAARSGVSTGTTAGAVTAGTRGGGRGGAGRGVASAGAASGGTASGVAGGGRGGRGRGASSQATGQSDRLREAVTGMMSSIVRAASYDAELWLVHRRPDGTETVQLQQLRITGAVGDYRFPPVVVPTSRGNLTLDFSGRLQSIVGTPPENSQDPFTSRTLFVARVLRNDATGEAAPQDQQRIMLSINRRARAVGAPLLDVTGGSTMLIDAPAPTDVLSFEFPSLQKSAEDLLRGHSFSLRVRATAVR